MTYSTKGLYINGEWDQTGYGKGIYSPIDGRLIGTAWFGQITHLAAASAAARNALDGEWSRWTAEDRAAALRRLADGFHDRQQDLGAMILAEVGSPVDFAYGPQIDHPLRIINYYASVAEKYRFSESRVNGGGDAPGTIVRRLPVGAVGIITPWNMPLKTIMMKVAPALAAGCTVVIKPAEETPFNAMVLAELVDAAGFPPGVVNVVPAVREDAAYLPTSTYLDKIAFTGSTAVGKWIAQQCGAAIRRYSLELGGKSPTVLLPDADLDAWEASVPGASLLNNGQICSNQTRILYPRKLQTEVIRRLERVLDRQRVGDPSLPGTTMGPLITTAAVDRYHAALRGAQLAGGTVRYAEDAVDPRRPSGGNWVTPALVSGVGREALIARKEVFGPVLVAMPYDNEPHAVELANDSPYGLHAGVWSHRKSAALAVANRLRVGQIQINGADMPLHTPLGGFKESGWGRELGPEGMTGYLETSATVASW